MDKLALLVTADRCTEEWVFEALEACGLPLDHIHTAETSDHAWSALDAMCDPASSVQPSLIVLDLRDRPALTFLKRLRGTPSGRRIPTLLIGDGHVSARAEARSYGAGASAVVPRLPERAVFTSALSRTAAFWLNHEPAHRAALGAG